MLLGEIFFIAGLLSQYRVDAFFVLQETFSDSLNQQFANLSQFNDSSCPFETGGIIQGVMSDLLEVTATNIQREPGYSIPFIVNCSVFFDSKIEQIICDTEFTNVQTLLSYEGNIALPSNEVSFLHKGNILKTNMVVGLEPLQHPQVLYWLYFKLPPTQTESQTNSLPMTTSLSFTTTDSNSGSRSRSRESSGSITSSAAESVSLTVSSQETYSFSSTDTASPSQTGTFSRTLSQSGTQIPSMSLSFSDELSDSRTLSETSSQTFSQSLTKSCSVPPLQNLTMWSSLAHEDVTNQTGRYIVACSIVIDTFTNLMWEQTPSTTTVTWNTTAVPGSSQEYCQSLTKGGYNDWRLPTPQELQSLVDYTVDYHGPTINTTVFPGTSTSYYYTSLPIAGSSTIPWYVSFGSTVCYGGLVYTQSPGWSNCAPFKGYPWCVRGSSTTPSIRYTDENGATLTGGSTQVKDQVTGLIWERAQGSSGAAYTWSATASSGSAQYYCNTLTLGSQTWRLPTGKELSTLVDYTIAPPGPTINVTAFPGTAQNAFWASTPFAGVAGYAWYVYFNGGVMGGYVETSSYFVRCVR